MAYTVYYKRTLEFSKSSEGEYYTYGTRLGDYFSTDNIYEIRFDNDTYIDMPVSITNSSGSVIEMMGNLAIVGLGEDTGEPFVIGTVKSDMYMSIQVLSGTSHTLHITAYNVTGIAAEYTGGPVAIGTDVTSLNNLTVIVNDEVGNAIEVTDYTIEGKINAGNNEVQIRCKGFITTVIVAGKLPDIIIKDRDGNDAIYSNARAIRVRTEDGVTKEYVNTDALPPSGIIIDDKAIKHTVYQIDNDNKLVTIYGVTFSKLYAETGEYTLYIPDTVGDCQVVIDSEGVR